MAEVYKKIEKKIVDLKEREEFWKAKYKEMAKQQKDLADSNSQQIKSMQQAIKRFDQRIKEMEEITWKINSKNEENLAVFEKKAASFSETAKELSLRLEEKEAKIKAIKTETASMVSGIIARHEKTFDTVIEKINQLVRGVQRSLEKDEGIYHRIESTKKFMENYRPPPVAVPPSAHQIPPAPAPQRFEKQTPEIPLFYEEPSGIPKSKKGLEFAEDEFEDIDEGPDVDDVIAGKVRYMGSSVDAINANVSGIAEKLAAIEGKVSKMQSQKVTGVDRIEDKMQLYRESVNEMRSRVEAVERAMKDGMAPMMESMRTLVDAVKEIKQDRQPYRPFIQRPTPPKIGKKLSSPIKLNLEGRRLHRLQSDI